MSDFQSFDRSAKPEGMAGVIWLALEEARRLFPNDPEAQALHVRRAVNSKRNQQVSGALEDRHGES